MSGNTFVEDEVGSLPWCQDLVKTCGYRLLALQVGVPQSAVIIDTGNDIAIRVLEDQLNRRR
jgi:hypothetical protein